MDADQLKIPPQTLFESVLTSFLRSPGMRERHMQYIAHGLYALVASEVPINKTTFLLNRPVQLPLAMKQFATSIHAIDDRIDTMVPESLLSAGKAVLGTAPSDFLRDGRIFHKEEYERAQKLVDLGLCAQEEGIAFANLAAHLVQQEAGLLIEYQRNKSPKIRQQVLETDRKITDVLLTFIVNWFHRSASIRNQIDATSQLTHDDIAACFPGVLKLFRVYEIMDDYRDLLQDLKQEAETGRPVANWFLTKLHERGDLLDSQGHLQSFLLDLLQEANRRKTPLALEDLPEPIVECVQLAVEEAKKTAAEIAPNAALVLRAQWNAHFDHIKPPTMPAAQKKVYLL